MSKNEKIENGLLDIDFSKSFNLSISISSISFAIINLIAGYRIINDINLKSSIGFYIFDILITMLFTISSIILVKEFFLHAERVNHNVGDDLRKIQSTNSLTGKILTLFIIVCYSIFLYFCYREDIFNLSLTSSSIAFAILSFYLFLNLFTMKGKWLCVN